MTSEKSKRNIKEGEQGLDGKLISKPMRQGRPKKNPHPRGMKLTVEIPAEVHRLLRFASADLNMPMAQITTDALLMYLEKYKGPLNLFESQPEE